MSFENHYLTCIFKETNDSSSSAEICSSMRNSIVRLHTESLQRLSNTSTNLILEQRIPEYSKFFNDNVEDNILGPIDSLLRGKIHTRHCSSWKSKLSSSNFDASNVVERPTDLSAHCSLNKNLPCKSDVISKADIHILLQKKNQTNDIQPSNNTTNIAQSYNPKIQPGGMTFFSSPQHNNQVSVNSYENKANECMSNPNRQSSSNIQKTFQYVQSKPVSKPTNNSYQPSSFSRTNSFENAPPRGNQCNSNNQPYSTNNQSYNSKNPSYNQSFNSNNPPINETVPSHQNSFRTARSELQIQNKKKYGNSNQNYQQIPENNIVKRSLGTTRSSVQNKFVPPLSSGNDEAPMESEEVEDERLKHIDPKMVELIKNEIIDSSAPIGWDDIAGLEFAKTAIQEAVVWPLLRPDIFTGLRRPPKGILLFGPPGTGKTLIGKCIASSCCATFFSISASSLTSKWIGDGEKMVRALFAVARCYQPAVVFIDEIDSLLTQRSDSEHEATRRIKTEFLVQLDGAATGDEDRLLVIGATNRPQELDEAARRRLVKRLYIPLPDVNARQQIVHRLMSSERNSLTEEDMAMVARLADGFSGADMRSLCSEAALGPIRAVPLSQITNIQCDQVRPVSVDDFKNALSRVRPSVSGNDLEHYIVWDKTYGSGSQRS